MVDSSGNTVYKRETAYYSVEIDNTSRPLPGHGALHRYSLQISIPFYDKDPNELDRSLRTILSGKGILRNPRLLKIRKKKGSLSLSLVLVDVTEFDEARFDESRVEHIKNLAIAYRLIFRLLRRDDHELPSPQEIEPLNLEELASFPD